MWASKVFIVVTYESENNKIYPISMAQNSQKIEFFETF
jgi:hypothetical protein